MLAKEAEPELLMGMRLLELTRSEMQIEIRVPCHWARILKEFRNKMADLVAKISQNFMKTKDLTRR